MEAPEGAPLVVQMWEVASRLDLSRNTVVVNMDHLQSVGLIRRGGRGRTAVWVYPPESIPPRTWTGDFLCSEALNSAMFPRRGGQLKRGEAGGE